MKKKINKMNLSPEIRTRSTESLKLKLKLLNFCKENRKKQVFKDVS